MRFPWVSRERLEEVQEQLRASENERKILLDRLAMLRGEPPLYAKPEPVVTAPLPEPPAPSAVHEARGTAKTTEAKQYVAGSVTPDYIKEQAARAVREGKIGVSARMN